MESVQNSNISGLFKFYTGFSYLTFMAIFNVLVPSSISCPFVARHRLSSLSSFSLKDQFFIVLCRLKQAFALKDLAFRCGISHQDISDMCTTWINFMYFTFSSIPIWPHRQVILSKMPCKFKSNFPNTLAIFDATEIKIQKPSSLVCQSQSYSEYKSTNTLKGLLAVDPRGTPIFISSLFSGSMSDNRLVHNSGLLKLLNDLINAGHIQRGDAIMCDKGFTNLADFHKLGLKLNIPPVTGSTGQMSAANIVKTRTIASHRIHVERAFARIKAFKILSHQVGISNITVINQIWFVCAFLTTFQPMLVQN